MTHALIFLLLMNVYRENHPLVLDPTLSAHAQHRAEYLCENNQWSHDMWLLSFAGLTWQYAGENLAKDYSSPYTAEVALMASKTHRDNILDSHYHKLGVGEDCGIVVQLFTD